MVEFMVVALPRSGTTWVANWLTTDTTSCLHDLINTKHYSEWDQTESSKTLGVSDTGIFFFPEWLNNHPARKVILHRDLGQINTSLSDIGLPTLTDKHVAQLNKVKGLHVVWTDIFDNPQGIYEYLLQKPFDSERHELLKEIEMQPNFAGLSVGKKVTQRIIEELRGF